MSTDREIAEAATPGPWTTHDSKYVEGKYVAVDEANGMTIVHATETWAKPEDAQFIAHFNPAKILDMLQENENAHKGLDVAIEAIKAATEYILILEKIVAAYEEGRARDMMATAPVMPIPGDRRKW